jgi:plastocyanin
MALGPGFSPGGALLAALLCALAAPLRADQTVQVGPGTAFSPATVTVAPGEAVIWSFQAFHTSTGDTATGPEVWDSGFLSTGTFSHTFTTPGSYPYYCQVHSVPGGTAMNGVVVVSGLGVTVTPTVPPATPSPSPTPSPTAPPTPTLAPGGPPATPAPPSSSIPTLDSTGTVFFVLLLAGAGFTALRFAARR